MPDAVDFVSHTQGTIFVRQSQSHDTSGAFSVALENPQTLVTSYRRVARILSGADGDLCRLHTTVKYSF